MGHPTRGEEGGEGRGRGGGREEKEEEEPTRTRELTKPSARPRDTCIGSGRVRVGSEGTFFRKSTCVCADNVEGLGLGLALGLGLGLGLRLGLGLG